jgi:hypothetical protein
VSLTFTAAITLPFADASMEPWENRPSGPGAATLPCIPRPLVNTACERDYKMYR